MVEDKGGTGMDFNKSGWTLDHEWVVICFESGKPPTVTQSPTEASAVECARMYAVQGLRAWVLRVAGVAYATGERPTTYEPRTRGAA